MFTCIIIFLRWAILLNFVSLHVTSDVDLDSWHHQLNHLQLKQRINRILWTSALVTFNEYFQYKAEPKVQIEIEQNVYSPFFCHGDGDDVWNRYHLDRNWVIQFWDHWPSCIHAGRGFVHSTTAWPLRLLCWMIFQCLRPLVTKMI